MPGIVVVSTASGVCTGTVVKVFDVAGAVYAWVLTAKHCVQDPKGLSVLWMDRGGSTYSVGARVAAAASGSFTSDLIAPPSGDAVEWNEDWAILQIPTPPALPVVPLFAGDPATDVAPGTEVSLYAYFDVAYPGKDGKHMARPHEHRFRWTGRPAELGQQGHSGSPVLVDGKVFAIFVGDVANTYGSRLVTGETWASRYRFVSIATFEHAPSTAEYSLIDLAVGTTRRFLRAAIAARGDDLTPKLDPQIPT